MRCGTFIQERIFEPLDLKMTIGYETPIAGKAVSYIARQTSTALRSQTVRWDAFGSGGIQTTPTQLVVWADNYRSGRVGGPAVQRAQLSGAVSMTSGRVEPLSADSSGGQPAIMCQSQSPGSYSGAESSAT